MKFGKMSIDGYEAKQNMLKMMENNVEMLKKELKQMEKEMEKEGLN